MAILKGSRSTSQRSRQRASFGTKGKPENFCLEFIIESYGYTKVFIYSDSSSQPASPS